MKILIWKSKHGDVYMSARTPKEEERAWLYLFECMDDDGYYCDLDGDESTAYKDAKEGDARGARWLLLIRSGYEYETITIEHLVEP